MRTAPIPKPRTSRTVPSHHRLVRGPANAKGTVATAASRKIRPAPKPWSTRNPIRLASFQDTEHRTDPTTKITSAAIHARLPPQRASAQPVTGIATVSASRYAVLTHCIVPTVECNLSTSVCSAIVTIVVSRIAAIPPMISASAARRTSGVSPGFPGRLNRRCRHDLPPN